MALDFADKTKRDRDGILLEQGYVSTPLGKFSLFDKPLTISKKNRKGQNIDEVIKYPTQEEFAALQADKRTSKLVVGTIDSKKKASNAE